jgi:AraC-like DNA-binding protein
VRAIAAATGYRDPFYLSRVFRRAEGVSPTGYRRARRSPVIP